MKKRVLSLILLCCVAITMMTFAAAIENVATENGLYFVAQPCPEYAIQYAETVIPDFLLAMDDLELKNWGSLYIGTPCIFV